MTKDDFSKNKRKEIGTWISSRLGKPDRNTGRWWTDEDLNYIKIFFRDDTVFVEFSLVWM